MLFSADGFGKFGANDIEDPEGWACEARRYYFGIVGKFGKFVQAVLKKAADLDIQIICPLHGPVLTENLGYYLDTYNTWSSYQPEDEGITDCLCERLWPPEGCRRGARRSARGSRPEGLRL